MVATHPAGVAFFHPEHNHWHQSGVAAFAIKKGDPYAGQEVATGVKITFCFVDVVFTGVTGLPDGDYYLTHQADPDNHWLEGPSATSPGELDNFTWLKFHLSRTGANPEVTEVAHSACFGPTCPGGANP